MYTFKRLLLNFNTQTLLFIFIVSISGVPMFILFMHLKIEYFEQSNM